ncbi:MAG: hypothetical protein QNJ73_14300 [Gammaproteobacteria bacterium]|nr:hypothetical protein [Gammaproteobacteria bacterium]
MTVPEILSLVAALAALLVALLALSRATAALQARAQVEAFMRDSMQTDVQVLFLKMDAGQYNFTLSNRGSSAARNIDLAIIDDVPAAHNPLTSAREQLPVKQLDPGGYVQIPVAVDADTPKNFDLKVSWVNAGGLETVKDVPLNLLD